MSVNLHQSFLKLEISGRTLKFVMPPGCKIEGGAADLWGADYVQPQKVRAEMKLRLRLREAECKPHLGVKP